MPYFFEFLIDNRTYFSCPLKCVQCKARTKRGTRCQRHVCLGTPYCHSHMMSELKLRVLQSNIAGAGKGLFAMLPREEGRVVVFEEGDTIVEYNGETVSQAELDRRYTDDLTAPYALCSPTRCKDAACNRSVGAFANHAAGNRANATFLPNASGSKIYLVATKDIYNKTEIKVDYGPEYRLREPRSGHETRRGKRSRKRYGYH